MAARPLCRLPLSERASLDYCRRLHGQFARPLALPMRKLRVCPARPGLSRFGAIVGPFPFLDSAGISQQEILDHKFAFAPGKQATAGAACYLAINGFRTGFGFDDLIERVAVRATEMNTLHHKTPLAERPHTEPFGGAVQLADGRAPGSGRLLTGRSSVTERG
jgi:hypothetical protein